tara:strand:+ start:226 stop:708 length:483 start_codon:yes stop_codon:yes gene_type:complete
MKISEETKKREEQIIEKICGMVLRDAEVKKYSSNKDNSIYYYNYDPAYHVGKIRGHLAQDAWYVMADGECRAVSREEGERRSCQIPYHLRKVLDFIDRKKRFKSLFRGEPSEVMVLLNSSSLDIWRPCTSLDRDYYEINPAVRLPNPYTLEHGKHKPAHS